jgi:xanthosine utilization system XapX-like protein
MGNYFTIGSFLSVGLVLVLTTEAAAPTVAAVGVVEVVVGLVEVETGKDTKSPSHHIKE